MVRWWERARERKHNVEYYHYSYVFMCKDKLICCGGFYFSYKCRFASVLFCWKEPILNISLDMEKLPLSAVSSTNLVPTSLQSAPMLCPIPCDAPLNDNSHKEACVCMSERECGLVLYGVCVCVDVGVCVCEFGGESRALYILAKEQWCVYVSLEWSLGESSKVEGQS